MEKHLLSHMRALFSIAQKILILSLDASDTGPISKTEFQLTNWKDDDGDVDHDDGSWQIWGSYQ